MPPVVLDTRRNPATVYENVDVGLARQYMLDAKAAAEGGGADTAKNARLATGFSTWAELQAFAPQMAAGDPATVSSADTGTHTDPVAGAGARNGGRYIKQAGYVDPVRVGDTDGQVAAVAASRVQIKPGLTSMTAADKDGRQYLRITPKRIIHKAFQALETGVAAVAAIGTSVIVKPGLPSFVMADAGGKVWSRMTPKRWVYAPFNALQALVAAQAVQIASLMLGNANARPTRDSKWDSIQAFGQYVHFMLFGQSLSLGAYSDLLSTTALTYAYRFNGGARPQDTSGTNASVMASLVPYVETLNSSTSEGETPGYGAIQMLFQLALADGINLNTGGQKLIGSSLGKGGTTLANMSNGTATFTRLKDAMTYGKSGGAALGGTYSPTVLHINEGQADYGADTARATFASQLRQLRLDAQAHAQSVTGNTRPLPVILAQSSAHPAPVYAKVVPTIALAQSDVAEDDYFAIFADWQLPRYASDKLHLTGASSKIEGAYYGLISYRWLWLGVKPAQFRPIRVDRQGDTLIATYPVEAGRKLVLTDAAAFTIGNGVGDATVGVAASSVALVGRDKIAVTATGVSAMANPTFRHGWPGLDGVARGGLRDNAGDALVFDPTGLNYPMHTYALVSETGVTA